MRLPSTLRDAAVANSQAKRQDTNPSARIGLPAAPEAIELTILMPCLNEAETLATCIQKAKRFLVGSGISGEVLIADNGSTDGSRQIANAMGARMVPVARKGYGAALLGDIAAARGRFIIMGDADDSYDFAALDAFVSRLRDRTELVMGNRFAGGIAAGAMPTLHRYLGNPVLSFLGRPFFGVKARDFHCGLRGFNTDRLALNAGICLLGGMAFFGYAVLSWAQLNFGPLSNPEIPRVVILGLTLIVIALQVFFSAFLLGVLQIPVMRRQADQ